MFGRKRREEKGMEFKVKRRREKWMIIRKRKDERNGGER